MPATATHIADFSVANAAVHEIGAQRVYTRTRWEDDWELKPHLYCNWASNAISPGISTAELSWNYGYGRWFDEQIFNPVLPDNGARRYVRIEFDNPFGLAYGWRGIIQGTGTQVGGVTQRVVPGFPAPVASESGQQTLHCVGLAKLLYDTVIRTSAWRSEEDGERYYIDRGLTFNAIKADGKPGGNKSSVSIDGFPVFSGKVLDDDEPWALYDMVNYLIQNHCPSDKNGVKLPLFFGEGFDAVIALGLGGGGEINTVETHGRSFGEILDQLFAYQRFWSWSLGDVLTDNQLYINFHSLTGEDIELPGGKTMWANEKRWAITSDTSGCSVAHVLSHAEAVDRVRYQGARGTSTFTINKSADNTAAAGWSVEQQGKFTGGAAGSDEFIAAAAASNRELMEKLHTEARGRDEVKPVFSRIIVRNDWDGVARNGAGAAGVDFCPHVTETARFKFNQRELHLLPVLPLRDGYNYEVLSSGGTGGDPVPPVKLTTGPFNHSPPLVFLKVPGSSPARYVNAEKLGLTSEGITVPGDPANHFSVRVSVPRNDRAVVLDVTGSSLGQGMLGFEAFGGNTWDWRDAVITVAACWDAHCEAIWPATRAELPDQDHIREALLDAGDTYRLDWLVPGAVIGTVQAPGHLGELVRCEAGGWIQDDREQLKDRARLAFAWYGVERRAITLSSTKLANGTGAGGGFVRLRAGNFVVSLDDRSVNSVVTESRIDSPPGTIDSPPPPPKFSWTTDFIRDHDLFLSPNLNDVKPAAAAASIAPAKPRPAGGGYYP